MLKVPCFEMDASSLLVVPFASDGHSAVIPQGHPPKFHFLLLSVALAISRDSSATTAVHKSPLSRDCDITSFPLAGPALLLHDPQPSRVSCIYTSDNAVTCRMLCLANIYLTTYQTVCAS